MSEYGYSVQADFWGSIPPESVEASTESILERLERVTQGSVVGASEYGVDLRFSLVYDAPQQLSRIAAEGEEIARGIVAGAGLGLSLEALGVQSDAHLERDLETPNFPELVGLSEIAEILGVSRQRVGQLRERDDFPKPVAELRSGPVWSRPMLTRFIEEWPRRSGRPSRWALFSFSFDADTLARADELLSDRERQVLRLAVHGATTREMAGELGISAEAARSAMRRVLRKLGVESRLEAAPTFSRHSPAVAASRAGGR